MGSHEQARARRRLARWGLLLAGYAGVSAYYRFRPQPAGINGWDASYRVPAERIRFHHDSTWHEAGERRSHRAITDRVRELISAAREVTLLDVFLFNLHHTAGKSFVPTTQQIADAFAAGTHPRYFITDPFNTSYGTARCEPLEWLRESETRICLTDLRRLRDNNLVYSPFWRLALQWLGTGRTGVFDHPLQQNRTTSVRAALEAANIRANHRKVLVADGGADGYRALITSSNLEDASCYFLNAALEVESQAVAHHFFEAERAVARMSGCPVPPLVPPAEPEGGDAEVTPLLGDQIKAAYLADIRRAERDDTLYLFTLFLADRDILAALRAADRRGVRVKLLLDQNKVSFGEPKGGFPNQLIAARLARETGIEVRWANTRKEESHTKFLMLRKDGVTLLNVGSANFTRRSLSNTNLEANLRVAVPNTAQVATDAWDYAHWMLQAPRSLDYAAGDGIDSRLKYYWSRLQEGSGLATW